VNLMVGQRLLGVLGITCDTAANGELALQRIAESRYDIVLMDCQMPVMDGYTATQRLREIEASGGGRRLPVIAMTANAMAGDRQKCLDAGMDDYLPKPVTRSELERCLNRWWDPEQSEPAPESSATATDSTQASVVPVVPAALATPSFEVPPPVAPVAPVASPAPAPFIPQAPAAFQHAAPAPAASPAADPQAGAVKRPQPAIIDHDVIEELRSMLGGEVDRLIEVFLDDSPRLINDLEAATLAPDYDALRDAAHSLKSSSANLGAMSLSAAAKRVELAARERSLERPAVAVALIANEFHRARTALLAMMQAPRN
jgi:CheY-like chemotaxis protein